MKIFRMLGAILSIIVAFSLLSSVAFATQTGETTEPTAPTETHGEFIETVGDVSVTNGSHSIDGKMPVFGSSKYLQTAAAAFLATP